MASGTSTVTQRDPAGQSHGSRGSPRTPDVWSLQRELVPGDIVQLEAGDVAPVDGRIIRSATFEVQEAAPTGESAPVAQGREHAPGHRCPDR